MRRSPEGACLPGALMRFAPDRAACGGADSPSDRLRAPLAAAPSSAEVIGDARQLLGDLPEAAGALGVVRLLRRLHPLGRAVLFHEAAWAEELATLDVGCRRRVQLGEGAV